MDAVGLRSPVLKLESQHLLKLVGVVGQQRVLVAEGMGRTQGVERTDR